MASIRESFSYIGIVLGAGAGLVAVNTLLAQADTSTPSAANSQNDVQVNVMMGLPPIGTILPFYGHPNALMNTGWVLCDGTMVSEANSFKQTEVHPFFWEKRLPDLGGRVLRGVSGAETVGNRAGSDQLSTAQTNEAGQHAHNGNSHTHALRERTGRVSNGGPDPGMGEYKIRDDHRGWTNAHHFDVGGDGGNNEGNHYHDLGGSTSATSSSMAQRGSHVHSISAVSIVPSYVAVRFIIRIK